MKKIAVCLLVLMIHMGVVCAQMQMPKDIQRIMEKASTGKELTEQEIIRLEEWSNKTGIGRTKRVRMRCKRIPLTPPWGKRSLQVLETLVPKIANWLPKSHLRVKDMCSWHNHL